MIQRVIKPKPLTFQVRLPGGQERLREIILYVAEKCQGAKRFGMIKLNKIIWRADFSSFAARHIPITGRRYHRLAFGPAPHEMRPLLEEMRRKDQIEIDSKKLPNNRVENRVVPIMPPQVGYFTEHDLEFVNEAIEYYWNKTGEEASDDSHGIAWATREDGDLMPYELAFISDAKLTADQERKFSLMAQERGWTSL